jgi:hypothetical protein
MMHVMMIDVDDDDAIRRAAQRLFHSRVTLFLGNRNVLPKQETIIGKSRRCPKVKSKFWEHVTCHQ